MAAVAFCGKVSNVSEKHNFYDFEQKYRTEKVDPAQYKQYEIKAGDDLKQCFEKLILLQRCASMIHSPEIHDIMYQNYLFAFKKFPNFAPIAAGYACFHKLTSDNTVESLKILLPFIQESNDYPIVFISIFTILNDAYHCETVEEDMVKYLGDNDYETGRSKLKLLCDYWYSKLDAKYTNNSEESLSAARKQMTMPQQQEAIAIWKKLLRYTNRREHLSAKIAKNN
jgi:hypothetical protein